MMLRAEYPHTESGSRTLSFKEGDKFIVVMGGRNISWWLVIDKNGQMGYIPLNYVSEYQATVAEIKSFIDNSIQALHSEKRNHEDMDNLKIKSLNNLLALKKKYEAREFEMTETFTISHRPSCTQSFNNTPEECCSMEKTFTMKKADNLNTTNVQKEYPVKPLSINEKLSCTSGSLGSGDECYAGEERLKFDKNATFYEILKDKTNKVNFKGIAHNLVEVLRRNTELSYNSSRTAVQLIISQLKDDISFLDIPLSEMLGNLCESSHVTPSLIESTNDAQRLRVIFDELQSCKNDEQQRSWALHEDKSIIVEYLEELIKILGNADDAVSKHVFSENGYTHITNLVSYYQMEPRRSIRILLLEIFGTLCGIDQDVIPILVNSVLPMELARDMLASKEDFSKLSYSGLVLTTILSNQDYLPLHYFDILNANFVSFLLDTIEETLPCDEESRLPDVFMGLVLALNIQFIDPETNMVVRSLQNQRSTMTFIEKSLLLINRGDDPSNVLNLKRKSNSVLKLFQDIFSAKETSSLVYTNDLYVLIDIIARHLADLSPDDEERQQFLILCQKVIRFANYEEHHHRQSDLLKSFQKICTEENNQEAKSLVKLICEEFPNFFSL